MSVFNIVTTIMVQAFDIVYKALDHSLIGPFLAFARGFEFAVIFAFAGLFLMISVFMVLRQARRLPTSYSIEITDLYGERSAMEGLRQTFATYDAAASYARLYGETYGPQYRFRVVGSTRRR